MGIKNAPTLLAFLAATISISGDTRKRRWQAGGHEFIYFLDSNILSINKPGKVGVQLLIHNNDIIEIIGETGDLKLILGATVGFVNAQGLVATIIAAMNDNDFLKWRIYKANGGEDTFQVWGYSGKPLDVEVKYPVGAPNKPYSLMGSNDGPQLPSVFQNKFPQHPTDFPKLISDTKLSQGAGTYNYVVLEDGQLVVGRRFNSPGGGHIDLANGKKVLAAGEVKIIHGDIKYIDNTSGHYEPFGINAQNAAENAFSQRGFDVTSKYFEKVWVPNPTLPGKGSWRPVNELDN